MNEDLKQQLKQGAYFARYLEETRGIQIGGSSEQQIKCPDSSKHTNGDKNPSARYYPSPSEHIHCHGCGGHWDLFDLIALDNGLDAKTDFPKILEICVTRWGLEIGDKKPQQVQPSVQPDPQQVQPQSYSKSVKDYIESCAAHYPETNYLKDRGISDAIAQGFRIGFDPKEQRIVFPQGSGYVGRSISKDLPDGVLRYKYPKGIPVAPFNLGALWNPDHRLIFIVEGQIDALSIVQAGGCAIGLGGMTHQKPIIDAIKSRPPTGPICVSFDNDGREDTRAQEKKLIDALKENGILTIRANLYPDGCKDANDALLKDPEALRLAISAAEEEIRIERMMEQNRRFTLWDVPDPMPEEDNPRALIKGGYFRKGHGMIIVSTSGAGKSVLSIQLALHFALGREIFGIKPVRPMKIGIVQAEDDREELGFFKVNMQGGLAEEYGWTSEDFERAARAITFETILGKTGDDFVRELKEIQKKERYDLIIVNPLFSYFGGNLSDSKDDTHFFRELIDPLIKNPVYGFGIVFIHHANKPPRASADQKGWGTDSFAQYIGAGGTDVAGWARAQLVLTPINGEFGWFNFIAAKRAGQLGWTDAEGKRTQMQIIAYGKTRVLWRSPSPEEIPESIRKEAKRAAAPDVSKEDAITRILDHLKVQPMKTTDLYNWCCDNFVGMKSKPEKPCKLAYLDVIGNPSKHGLEAVKQKYGAVLLRSLSGSAQPTLEPQPIVPTGQRTRVRPSAAAVFDDPDREDADLAP